MVRRVIHCFKIWDLLITENGTCPHSPDPKDTKINEQILVLDFFTHCLIPAAYETVSFNIHNRCHPAPLSFVNL